MVTNKYLAIQYFPETEMLYIHYSIRFSQKHYKLDSIKILVLEMRKLKLRESIYVFIALLESYMRVK